MRCPECKGVGHAPNDNGQYAECFNCLGKAWVPSPDWEKYRVYQRDPLTIERVRTYFKSFLFGVLGYGVGAVLERIVH